MRVGVTVAKASDAKMIRRKYGPRVAIFVVHCSGMTSDDAITIYENADIATACASKNIREMAKTKALLQVGNKVPIYALSLWGELLLKERLVFINKEARTGPDEPPRPLF